VGVSVNYDGACLRDRQRLDIRSIDPEKRINILYSVLNLEGVHYYEKSVVTLRARSMRIELYSRYNRQGTAFGNALANFKSVVMSPFVGGEAWPSDAARSGVRSYTIIKNPFIYMS